MQTRRISHRDAQTFLVHMFGRGLDDDRYVIERYRSKPDGEICSVEAEQPKNKAGRKPRPIIASVSTVKKMRPERDEIIVCTGVNLARSGVQLWGLAATGLYAARNPR